MKEINTQFNFPTLGPSINSDPQAASKTTIKNVDEARGYVAALGLRYQDQFSAASTGLAEKMSNGQLDEDSYLLLTSAMVDASRVALAR
ncbi:hypothetical protein IFR08_20520 [Pseudomonas fluorescens]|jgi:hypothetical protein|uniref:Uncharacterized protein n=1 Tax=Pseudomonas fluorescens TaxID=294 RepID=A0A2N1EDS2_PSEFL|nr:MULTISPECIES: hypothetical protein [Pseudomonas]MBD8096917.1 hypothetical protein [Pseudomonas fluorescens]MBD8776113.1 hypothetical protein [Pseudomonas fluorescens]MBD8780603.1 hypothetical protein [Pseudomonas fluorescens]MBD8797304.1 hypothetical protein [Pseudomonas fluorescens]PKH25677.1 hypothetical protein CIB54_04685 [Pseudomonas fluorescens]